jgi:hypothetical protein
VLSPRMVALIADLMQDWRRLDERIAVVSTHIEALAQHGNSAAPPNYNSADGGRICLGTSPSQALAKILIKSNH